MSLTAQELESLTRILTTVAEAAVAKGVAPLDARLGRMEGQLMAGAARMDGHDLVDGFHTKRLDGHDVDIGALQRRRAAAELSPASGTATVAAEKRRRVLLAILTGEALPRLLTSPIFLLTLGAFLPVFGKALIALGEWLQHLSRTP